MKNTWTLETGIAVNSLGYSHPILNNALIEQAKKLWHVSNVYNIPEQETLAKKLCERSFADNVFSVILELSQLRQL